MKQQAHHLSRSQSLLYYPRDDRHRFCNLHAQSRFRGHTQDRPFRDTGQMSYATYARSRAYILLKTIAKDGDVINLEGSYRREARVVAQALSVTGRRAKAGKANRNTNPHIVGNNTYHPGHTLRMSICGSHAECIHPSCKPEEDDRCCRIRVPRGFRQSCSPSPASNCRSNLNLAYILFS